MHMYVVRRSFHDTTMDMFLEIKTKGDCILLGVETFWPFD